jgi:hypothetical protein
MMNDHEDDGHMNLWDQEPGRAFTLNYDFVLRKIKEKDPIITCAYINDPGEDYDWEAAGKCLGSSSIIKSLSMTIYPSNLSGAVILCRGLVLNKSIERLTLGVFPDISEEERDSFFNAMLPFFRFNNKLTQLSTNFIVLFL